MSLKNEYASLRVFAGYFYTLCKESDYVPQQETKLYFGVWIISTVVGIVIQLLECFICCYISSESGERALDCIYGFATLFSNVPLIFISLVTFEYMPLEVCQGPTTEKIITAVDINVLLHLPPLVYRIARPCKHECSCYSVIFHLIGLVFVCVVILHSLRCILFL